MPGPLSDSLRPALEPLLLAISHPGRWAILRELSLGEQLMVAELAERIGVSAGSVSKNLVPLRSAGLVHAGRNRLNHIPAHFRPTPGERVLDFGHCLLRLDAAA